LGDGDELEVEASVGMGRLQVIVPVDAALDVTTQVGAGQSRVFGEEQEGVGVDTRQSFDGDVGLLVLDLHVGLGEVEVRSDASRPPVPSG
jgi:hypothetical protein